MSLSGGSGTEIVVDSQTVNIPAVNITGAVNAGGVSAGAVTATGDVTAGGDIASSGVVTCTGAVTQNVTNQTLSATVSNVNLGSGNSITCGSLIVDTTTLNGTGLTNSTGTLSLDATNLTTTGAVVGTSFKGDILSDNAALCLRNGATPADAKFLGLSARAEQLQTSRSIAGEPFNGSADITLACANMTDITSIGSGSIISSTERTKLNDITSVGSGSIITAIERSTLSAVGTIASGLEGTVRWHRFSAVGINTSNTSSTNRPFATLDVGDWQSGLGGMSSDTRRFFRYNSGTTLGSNPGTGSVGIYSKDSVVSGNFIVAHAGTLGSSDDRIKSEETPIENATDTVVKLKPCSYFKHPSHRVAEDDEAPVDKDASGNVIDKFYESGLIAQDVGKIKELEHLVIITPDYGDVDTDTLAINYTGLIPFLVKSIQELNARIIKLENEP